MNISVDDLLKVLDEEQELTLNAESQQTKKLIDAVPLLGKIAAGSPIFADENIESYMPVMPSILSKNSINDLFYLRVCGESMNERIPNNSFVLVKKQEYAENDDIVVAIVNGDNEATLKRYHQINDHMIVLKPESNDKSFKEIYIDLKTTDFLIVGKVIGYYIDNI